jgi:hypothetical protein
MYSVIYNFLIVPKINQQLLLLSIHLPPNLSACSFVYKSHGVVLINPHPSTPPLHPNFNLFTPTPLSPKCATYIRCNKGLSAHTTFTYKDSFISTHISLSEAVKFTLYNFYSPGHPKSLASLRDDFRPSLPCILLGDFNAHHEWWYGQLAVSTCKTRAFHAHRRFSKIIVDRLEDNNFTLQILRGPDPFPSPKGPPKHSDRSLFLRRNDISIYTYLDNKPRSRV